MHSEDKLSEEEIKKLFTFEMPERTRRADLNCRIKMTRRYLIHQLKLAFNNTSDIVEFNFDLRQLSTQESIELLGDAIEFAHSTKKLWLDARQELDSLIYNIDHLIERCAKDKKKYEAKLNGETKQGRAQS